MQYLYVDNEPLAWQSENQAKVPKRCVVVDDSLRADEALRLARAGMITVIIVFSFTPMT